MALGMFGQTNNMVVGTWLLQDGSSKVSITKNEDGTFDGKIIWLKNPTEKDGSDKTDKRNPKVNLRSRKILGLKLLNNFSYDAIKNEWNGGTIYDPNSGNTYKCYMWFEKTSNKLLIKGFIGISLIGRKVSLTRVDESV